MILFTLDQLKTVPNWEWWDTEFRKPSFGVSLLFRNCHNDYVPDLHPDEDLEELRQDYKNTDECKEEYIIDLILLDVIESYSNHEGYEEFRKLIRPVSVNLLEYIELYECIYRVQLVSQIIPPFYLDGPSNSDFILAAAIARYLRNRIHILEKN